MKILGINFSSLRYRITIMLVILSAIVVGYILWQTLSYNAVQMRKQLDETDNVTVDLLADLARISLFSFEYDSIQTHVTRIHNDKLPVQTVSLSELVVQSDRVDLPRVDPIWDDSNLLLRHTRFN